MAMLTGSCLSFAVFSNRIISPPVTTTADHWSLYQGLRVMTCRMRPFGGLAEKGSYRSSWQLGMTTIASPLRRTPIEIVVS